MEEGANKQLAATSDHIRAKANSAASPKRKRSRPGRWRWRWTAWRDWWCA